LWVYSYACPGYYGAKGVAPTLQAYFEQGGLYLGGFTGTYSGDRGFSTGTGIHSFYTKWVPTCFAHASPGYWRIYVFIPMWVLVAAGLAFAVITVVSRWGPRPLRLNARGKRRLRLARWVVISNIVVFAMWANSYFVAPGHMKVEISGHEASLQGGQVTLPLGTGNVTTTAAGTFRTRSGPHPMWPFIAVWTSLAGGLFLTTCHRSARVHSGCCTECDYDLRGSTSDCPECGAPSRGNDDGVSIDHNPNAAINTLLNQQPEHRPSGCEYQRLLLKTAN
jgi:hypothetical protein